MSNLSLQGKTAIITGGAGGLGRAMVAKYAQAGPSADAVKSAFTVLDARAVVLEAKAAAR